MSKALTTLHNEFKLAVLKNNVNYARTVLDASKKMHSRLSQTYRESEELSNTMSYSQRIIVRKIKTFIKHLTQQLKTHFGISHDKAEIEQAIGI